MQLPRQYYRDILRPLTLKNLLRYPGLLKFIIILNLVTICITHARQIKSGKLIIWLNFSIFMDPC